MIQSKIYYLYNILINDVNDIHILYRKNDIKKNEALANELYIPKKQIGVETDPILFTKSVDVLN